MKSVLLLAALFAVPGEAASGTVDARWVPWLGCWELAEDETREPLIGESDPTRGSEAPERALLCLNPAPDGKGVTVTTASDGEAFLEETLIADGEKNPSSKGNCAGWQKTEWSNDGYRIFTTAKLTCEENRELEVSGLSMMTGRSTWVDVQIVESRAGRAVMIRRYRPADDEEAAEAGLPVLDAELAQDAWRARFPLTEPLDTNDVLEATKKVAPEAVEAAILEHGEGFELDAEALIALDDAEVRTGLIDLMVALSYPDQFVVKRPEGGSGGGFGFPTFSGYGTPYAFRHPYYMAPFGYYYWYAPYDPRFVVRPVAISSSAVSQGLVSTRGYAQVSPRPTNRRARYRGGSGGGDAYSAGGGSGSSSSGSVSSQGYTRGGSSGRSAKPKKK